jgi:hypothetical protein
MSYAPVSTDLLGDFPAQMKRIAEETEAKVAGSVQFAFWTGRVTPNADGRFYVSFPELGSLAGVVVQNSDPGSGGYAATPNPLWAQCGVRWQVLGPPAGTAVWVQQEWIEYYNYPGITSGGPGRVYATGKFVNQPMQVSVIGWGPPK